MHTTDFLNLAENGLEVIDIPGNLEFAGRPIRSRDAAAEMEAMRRIAHAFVESPDTVLQELVNAGMQLCGCS